ncbi:hypothetical protein LCGC14_2825890 [marine sediment metagenome]|uniref:Uncharacterized protein n=1 Tax=marine sediment metagenome TaxID=412755 RepID=A0A0F8YFF1_9ZZZZ
MRKYVGPGYVPGVPARDLTEEEYRYWVAEHKAGRTGIEEGKTSALYKKEQDKAADEAAAPVN